MDINITIKCPDLPLAAAAIAKALMGVKDAEETPTSAMPQAAAPAPAPVMAAPAVNPTAPSEATPTASSPAMTTPAAAMTAPTVPTSVPTTPAPQITGDMVASAGAEFIRDHREMLGPLNALLQKYGVTCATELRPDQIGPFATEMRALGAKI